MHSKYAADISKAENTVTIYIQQYVFIYCIRINIILALDNIVLNA